MKILFHEQFLDSYTVDPAAAAGRLEPSVEMLKRKYSLVEPAPCSVDDVMLVHTQRHLKEVQSEPDTYKTALLAAGATIEAAQFAREGEAAFALCRPPGHHASPDSCWGFCYFNNVAIAVKRFLREHPEQRVLIVDFDLHYGDGTDNAVAGEPGVTFYAFRDGGRTAMLKNAENFLTGAAADMVAVSAGFDRHINDWGRTFTDDDYWQIGRMLRDFALEHCPGRIFAALEGGYNARSLATGISAFLEGLT